MSNQIKTCPYALVFGDNTFMCIMRLADPENCVGVLDECEFVKFKPYDPDMKMQITEIYPAISGEGSSTGMVCTIVRTVGCNEKCNYCDSRYAYEGGDTLTVKDVLDVVLKFGIKTVLFTGGEPLLDINIASNFLRAMLENEIVTYVETNGSIDISPVRFLCKPVIDVKCPSSGMADKMYWPNLDALSFDTDVKFVVANEADYIYAKKVIRERRISERTPFVYISPVWPSQSDMTFVRDLSRWMIRDRCPARLSLQQHKIIWGPTLRGV